MLRQFIARQNVRRFNLLLETERDPNKRAQIQRLLTQAIADLDEVERRAPSQLYPPSLGR